MDDQLLDDYLAELAWLRTASGEFAREHPQVASRLRLSEFDCPDPHVERLLESFALQSARLHRRLDDGYGELCDALLEQLSPHLLRPFPACANVSFTPDVLAGDLTHGYAIPAGTPLYALSDEGETLWWRTTLEQTLWPVTLDTLSWCDASQAQQQSGLPQACGGLRIGLRCLSPYRFSSLNIKTLRIHLSGSPQVNAVLFDLLYAHAIGALRPQPVGVAAAESVLPTEVGVENSGVALSALMHSPQMLMYFDLPLPDAGGEGTLTLFIPFDALPPSLPPLQPGDIRPGCAPVVNLFTHTSEPVTVNHTRSEHRLVADHTRENIHIYRLRELWMSTQDKACQVPPYYAAQGHSESRWYWQARRHQRQSGQMWLTLVDNEFTPYAIPEHSSLMAKMWCSNGEAAATLGAGAVLTFEQPGPIAQVCLLGSPTRPGMPLQRGDARWKLVSSLALNHVSLTEGAQGLASLKERLALYVPPGASPAVWQQINGISAMRSRRVSEHRGREAWRGWRNGLQVALTLDPQSFTGNSRVLFAAILARYLAHNATANCFVRTVLMHNGRELPLWNETRIPTLIA